MRSPESQLAFAVTFGDVLLELNKCGSALEKLIPYLAPFENANPQTVHSEMEAVKALAVIEESYQHLEDIRTRCHAYRNTLTACRLINDLNADNVMLQRNCEAKLAQVIKQNEQVSRIHQQLRTYVSRQ